MLPRALVWLAALAVLLVGARADTTMDYSVIPNCTQDELLKVGQFVTTNARKLQCDTDLNRPQSSDMFHVTDQKVLCPLESCKKALEVAATTLPNCTLLKYPIKALANDFLLNCGFKVPTGSLADDANATKPVPTTNKTTWTPANASGDAGAAEVTTEPVATTVKVPEATKKGGAPKGFGVAGAVITIGATLLSAVW